MALTERQRECKRRYRRTHREELRAKARLYAAKRRREDPELIKKRVHDSWHKYKAKYLAKYKGKYYNSDMNKLNKRTTRYGVTPEQYDLMVVAQGNACKICGHSPKENDRALAIDHDHTSGKIRGLLCTNCNLGLGSFKDNPAALVGAARYLLGLMEVCHSQ